MKLAQGNPLLYNKNVHFKAPKKNYIDTGQQSSPYIPPGSR